ncbi:hypothetical protein [Chlorogloeopsis sp. ULAP02]
MANLIKSELQFLRQSAIGNDKERQKAYGRGQTRGRVCPLPSLESA